MTSQLEREQKRSCYPLALDSGKWIIEGTAHCQIAAAFPISVYGHRSASQNAQTNHSLFWGALSVVFQSISLDTSRVVDIN